MVQNHDGTFDVGGAGPLTYVEKLGLLAAAMDTISVMARELG